MKQSAFVTNLAMLVLFAGVVVYLGASAWQSLTDPFSTVMAYAYTVDDAAEATGWLAREETVLPAGSGIVDIVPDEGEKLGAGQTVAVLYRDEEALERRQTIRALELERDQLEYSLRQDDDGAAEAGKLDEEIFSVMTALRAAAARGDYSGLDDQALSLKGLVFRREYMQSGNAAAEIERLIASVSAQIAALQLAAAADTSTVAVDRSGVYSSLVDGYEEIFTPAALDALTVSGLSVLAAAPPEPDGNALGKLVTGSRWYLAVPLPEAQAARLYEGALVTVSFTRDFTGEVVMRVEHISAPENGRRAVVLSSTRSLADTAPLRRQTVDLIFARKTGVRVPKKALRVRTETVTDPDTGVETASQVTGVYVLTGAAAEFRAVSVVAEGEDFYLLGSPGGAGGHPLRAGDEVIVAAEELYDGKVVR